MLLDVGRYAWKGFESLQADTFSTPNTLISADVDYLDAVYDSYSYLYPNLGAPPVTSCPYALTTTGADYTVNCSGRTPPQSPRWSLNAGLQQTIPVGYGVDRGYNQRSFPNRDIDGS